MNKEQLKELVKQHFNLVDKTPVITEEKFGEVYDENGAFKIVFPGDTLKVGDEVKVVTKEGQESLAPDGYHKLADGTMIKTEGSSVVEITSPEGEKEEEDVDESHKMAKFGYKKPAVKTGQTVSETENVEEKIEKYPSTKSQLPKGAPTEGMETGEEEVDLDEILRELEAEESGEMPHQEPDGDEFGNNATAVS